MVAQSIALIRHVEVGECLAALCEELQQRRLPPRRLNGGLLHGVHYEGRPSLRRS